MMNRNETFLTTFENIEVYIRRLHHYSRDPLSMLVNTSSDVAIKRNKKKLETLMTVRNALAHNGVDNYVDVKPEILNLVEEVYLDLPIHKKAQDYMTKSPVSFDMDDALSKPLQVIKESKLIRFPIYQNDILVGVLSDNGISHWLAENIDNDVISIQETRIYDVVKHDEYFRDIHYISQYATYSDIFLMFEKTLGTRILLVTEHGRNDEPLLGVITRGDIL